MPKHEEQSPSRRDFLIQMFEDVFNVYNGFKHLHSRRNSEPLRKAILRAWTRERRFDDMPTGDGSGQDYGPGTYAVAGAGHGTSYVGSRTPPTQVFSCSSDASLGVEGEHGLPAPAPSRMMLRGKLRRAQLP